MWASRRSGRAARSTGASCWPRAGRASWPVSMGPGAGPWPGTGLGRPRVWGFHGIWVFDHFQPYPARDDSRVLEAWTTLAALSEVTDRVVLGTLVSCAGYRNAGVTVKMEVHLCHTYLARLRRPTYLLEFPHWESFRAPEGAP
jgi:Luciferase-like monooxygenase